MATGAEQLFNYWIHGEGASMVRWGTDGDLERCVQLIGSKASDPQLLCSVLRRRALGVDSPTYARGDGGATDGGGTTLPFSLPGTFSEG